MAKGRYTWDDKVIYQWIARYGLTDWLGLSKALAIPANNIQKRWERLRGTNEGRAALAAYAGKTELDIDVPEPLEADHPELSKARRDKLELQNQIRVLRKQLTEADTKKSIVGQLTEIVEANIVPFTPRKLVTRGVTKGRPVDGVAILSDEHADHVVKPEQSWGLEDYDFDIFRIRLQRWVEKIVQTKQDYLSNYRFERLWIASLGDKQQGSIHDMKHQNHFGNDIRAMLAIADAEADAIQQLLDHFPEVIMVCCSGNHPRTTVHPRIEDPSDNLDFAVACGIARRLVGYGGRFRLWAPRSWTAFMRVRGWNIAINHGDWVRGYAGFPWYGYDRVEGKVKALVARHDEKIDYFFYGHFHTATERTTADSRSLHNGAFFFTDAYAGQQLKVGTNPEQTLLVFEDKEENRGYTAKIPLYVRDAKREAMYRRGEWEPEIGRSTILDTVSDIPGELSLPIIEAVL